MAYPPLPRKDWAIIGLLAFFLLAAFTVELYWVVYASEVQTRAGTEFLAYLYRIYRVADRGYYDWVAPLPMALESFNVFVTQPLNLWLIYAILARKPYRHTLHLILGSYVSYSVLLYFWAAHVSGYESMVDPGLYSFFVFYTPNLPWLLAHLYMTYDSSRAINQLFRTADVGRISNPSVLAGRIGNPSYRPGE